MENRVANAVFHQLALQDIFGNLLLQLAPNCIKFSSLLKKRCKFAEVDAREARDAVGSRNTSGNRVFASFVPYCFARILPIYKYSCQNIYQNNEGLNGKKASITTPKLLDTKPLSIVRTFFPALCQKKRAKNRPYWLGWL